MGIKWCYHNKEDFYLEDNNQENLIVIFASEGLTANETPRFNFVNLLKDNKSYNKLFIRDIKRNYYMNGLGKTTKDFYETIDFIKKIISKKNYKNVFSLGCSSGGYAAILFGNILKFKKVLAFNPHSPHRYCLNLKNLIPFSTQVEIHYSEFSEVDKNYATYIEHDNCVLIKYESSTHLLAYQLRESGKLKSIILEGINIGK